MKFETVTNQMSIEADRYVLRPPRVSDTGLLSM